MNTHPIFFTYSASNKLKIPLQAEVQILDSASCYHITNIHPTGQQLKPVLPDITIKRISHNGLEIWVHVDSNMPSDLSSAIGKILENTLPEIHSSPLSPNIESDDFSLA